jgi:hypothetical protein
MWYGILTFIIILLLILLFYKKEKDYKEETQQRNSLIKEIDNLSYKKNQLSDTLTQQEQAIEKAAENYRKTISNQFEESKKLKKELEDDYNLLVAAKRRLYQEEVYELEVKSELEKDSIIKQHCDYCDLLKEEILKIDKQIADKKETFISLLEPIKLLQQIEQEKRFYCLNLTEKEQEDINFLMSEVSPRVNNKDIIPKLVWSEYIQKPTQEMTKRLKIDDSPGIYKITNIKNNKCYIGKSTKVRQRIIDHIKGSLGISSISDQFIHREMIKEGLNNWTFECVCYCEKDQLSEKEKYYIDFFNAKDWGYNIVG